MSAQIFLYDLKALTDPLINISDNTLNNYNPQISGDNVVWQVYDGNDNEIYFYNGSETTRLTDNDYVDESPKISGDNVVWQVYDGIDYEIYSYNGSETTRLTDNDYWDYDPQISGNNVVWAGHDGYDYEIYSYNGSETTRLTDNDYWDYDPQISGNNVVWQGYVGNDHEIYFYNGTNGITTQLTDNDYSDESPRISGNNVVWRGYDGYDYEIYFYNGTTTQLTDNDYWDESPQISGNNVVWMGYDDHGDFTGDNDIYLYNISSGETINLSEPKGKEDYVNDSEPQISGDKVVWVRYVNDPPIANDDTLGGTFLPNTTTSISKWSLLSNDYGENVWDSKMEVSSSDTATVELDSDGNVLFTPKTGLSYPNSATFSYTLEDRFGAVSAPATVTVNLGALVKGTNRANTLFGTELADRIEGLGGDDLLQGLDGDDILLGGTGRDVLKGGAGSDRLVGGAGADRYIGVNCDYWSNDTVALERFNDSLLRAPDVIEVETLSYYYPNSLNIDVPGGSSVFIPWNSNQALLTPSLREKDIKNILELYDSYFVNQGATFFQYHDRRLGMTKTFLAIDDGDHVFSGSSDSIIEVRGDFNGANIF